MLESSVTQQEDFYRKNLADIVDQHAQEVRLLHERAGEAESRFLQSQQQLNDELTETKNECQKLKVKLAATAKTGDSVSEANFLLSLQNDNNALHQRIKEFNAEKDALEQRYKARDTILIYFGLMVDVRAIEAVARTGFEQGPQRRQHASQTHSRIGTHPF
jgi:hypothetical protein